ncbi:MAG: type II CRISPR RNA-guided endonuclease Cas9 [Rhodospirillales bacterium]|nr:type II CRISPR RNA-guided endonuclease Cas9 [Rhodospirillales bacterium]
MQRVFGLDIGTTSIGFAVIDHDPASRQGQLHRLGVRIFPEARDPEGTPLNQTRRQKRMLRRQFRRRRQRRRALNEALARAGFLPPYGSPQWAALMASDPIALRVRGLTERLDPQDLGRALYHLAHRRHYRERDLEDDTSEPAPDGESDPERKPGRRPRKPDATGRDAKEAAERERRTQTVAELRISGATLAQYLQQKSASAADGTKVPRVRQRGRHALRANVADEFHRLCTAQAAYHPTLRDADFRGEIETIIFAQRPVFWRPSTLGVCRLMPGAPLAPKASWLSQQRRMLEKLNNLALVGGNARPLDSEERAAILAKLQSQGKMSWAGVRAALRPLFAARGDAGAEKRLRFNLEDDKDESNGLLGNPLEAKFADIFGDAWLTHPHRDAIRAEVPDHLLWEADYDRIGKNRIVIRREAERRERRGTAAGHFAAAYAATPDQARRLADLKLPTGWEPFSTDALRLILPELERGERFGTLLTSPDPRWVAWRDTSFPNREKPTGEILPRLPSPATKSERERLATIRNPTVIRAQNELRKVVNNLIAVYGLPDLIRIELARDIGLSKKQREEKSAAIRANTRRRKEALADLAKNGIAQPSPEDIEKWLLWQECGCVDPYSGQPIGFADLFRTNAFEVEHIWPRSRSFDDGMRNKTLCARLWNQRKGQRTPFQAFGHTEDWTAMSDRVWKMVGPRGMPKGKAKRFCHQGELDDGFVDRQLNDTGYAARQAMAQLRRLWPDAGPQAPVTVQPVTGRVTGHLRRLWGLNHILADDGEKTRADHRHHAIDALVVACTHPGITQRLSRYFQAKDDPAGPAPVLAPPWDGLRAAAQSAAAAIVVSHRVRRKISGPLHKETTYGDTGEDVALRGQTYRYFVARKPVEALGKNDLDPKDPHEGVRDPAIRALLRQWVAEHGGDPKKAFATYPRVGADGPEIRRVRVVFKQSLSLMTPVTTGYADISTNHHIAIYRLPDGKADFEVVSLVEAARRAAARQPIIRVAAGSGCQFVFALSPGDAIEFPDGEHKGLRIVQGVWASGQIVLNDHRDATGASVWRPTPSTILSSKARKLAIDPIGNKRIAND